jgi:hypothetical protein
LPNSAYQQEPVAHQALETTPAEAVTTMFVQVYIPGAGALPMAAADCPDLGGVWSMIESAVAACHGDVAVRRDDTMLAFFAAEKEAAGNVNTALDTAVSVMNEVTALNRRRLAQELSPLRVGIGLDAGFMPAERRPRTAGLARTLARHISQAKELSDLNRQTPFPAVFVSRSIVEGLARQNGYLVQNLGNVLVGNRCEPLAVYAILHD